MLSLGLTLFAPSVTTSASASLANRITSLFQFGIRFLFS